MPSFDENQVRRLAHLARISLREEEVHAMVEDLNALMQTLSLLPGASDEREREKGNYTTRPDLPSLRLKQALAFAAAPNIKEGLYRAPGPAWSDE